MQNVETKIIND